MATIRYNGWTYEGQIIGEMIRYGEKYVEVAIQGFVTSKWLHYTHIQTKTA